MISRSFTPFIAACVTQPARRLVAREWFCFHACALGSGFENRPDRILVKTAARWICVLEPDTRIPLTTGTVASGRFSIDNLFEDLSALNRRLDLRP
jgi:hypothetical protein